MTNYRAREMAGRLRVVQHKMRIQAGSRIVVACDEPGKVANQGFARVCIAEIKAKCAAQGCLIGKRKV